MRTNGTYWKPAQTIDLAALRQNKGISLREIADSTKISMRFLLAIEEGNFDQLPGGIYNTSYIRQYARAIDCEEAKLLDYYRAMTAALAV